MPAQKGLGHRRNQVAIYVAQLAHLRGPYQTAIYVAHQMTTYVAYQITTYVVPFFAFVFVLYVPFSGPEPPRRSSLLSRTYSLRPGALAAGLGS